MADSKSRANPRRGNSTRRNQARQTIKRRHLPCALCGQPIDYSLPAGHPMSYELDEIIPVSKGGSPYRLSNLQPAHRICNARRSNKSMEEWRSQQKIIKNTKNMQKKLNILSRKW